jgi:hypothetical protein
MVPADLAAAMTIEWEPPASVLGVMLFIYSPAPREAIAARFDPLQEAKLAGPAESRQS